VDQELFLKWMTHFIAFVKPLPDAPHLLLLDGHINHKSLAVIDWSCTTAWIPPHSTHKLQSLDRVMYGPLTTYYAQECDKWMVSNLRKRISGYNLLACSLLPTLYVFWWRLNVC